MFQTKFVEKIETQISCPVTFFPQNRAVFEIMWKNVVNPDMIQMAEWHICFASWITKDTNTHSEYVILIAFPMQQWLHECASMLHYMYIDSLLMSAIQSIQTKWNLQTTWCFSDRASWIDYILITNLMHWLLFIHKILFSSTCFKPQVLIFRRIQLYTCSIWYSHSLQEFMVACRYTA